MMDGEQASDGPDSRGKSLTVKGREGRLVRCCTVRGLDCDVATVIYTCDQTAEVTDTHAQISVRGCVITRHAVVETG